MAIPKLLASGAWRVQVQIDGQRLSETFSTKRKAQAWLAEQGAKSHTHRGKTLEAAIDRYLETVTPSKRGRAPQWEAARFAQFLLDMGDRPMMEIDSDVIAKWRDKRSIVVSGSTIQREVNLFRNLFITAMDEWRWISVNPFRGVKLPTHNPPRQAVWGWKDIRRVLRAGQRTGGKTLEVAQAFRISLHTSLRLQEALLAPSLYNARTGVITLPRSKVSLIPEHVPTVRRARRVIQSTPVPVVGANEASTLFSKLCRQALIGDLEFRDARATCLTLLARRVDVLTLARISRHRNLELLRSTYYRETAADISKRL